MKIKLNGEIREIDNSINNIEKLVENLKDSLPKLFVIEHNQTIIYKEEYQDKIIQENDEIEIVVFTGGG